jgi:hypothetical protein
LRALFPDGITGGIFREGYWLYFLFISGKFSLNSVSKEEACILDWLWVLLSPLDVLSYDYYDDVFLLFIRTA